MTIHHEKLLRYLQVRCGWKRVPSARPEIALVRKHDETITIPLRQKVVFYEQGLADAVAAAARVESLTEDELLALIDYDDEIAIRAELWSAINDYAVACGGTPGSPDFRRFHAAVKAIAAVEDAVRINERDARDEARRLARHLAIRLSVLRRGDLQEPERTMCEFAMRYPEEPDVNAPAPWMPGSPSSEPVPYAEVATRPLNEIELDMLELGKAWRANNPTVQRNTILQLKRERDNAREGLRRVAMLDDATIERYRETVLAAVNDNDAGEPFEQVFQRLLAIRKCPRCGHEPTP